MSKQDTCPTCGETRFWKANCEGAPVVCLRCHPPVIEDVVLCDAHGADPERQARA